MMIDHKHGVVIMNPLILLCDTGYVYDWYFTFLSFFGQLVHEVAFDFGGSLCTRWVVLKSLQLKVFASDDISRNYES